MISIIELCQDNGKESRVDTSLSKLNVLDESITNGNIHAALNHSNQRPDDGIHERSQPSNGQGQQRNGYQEHQLTDQGVCKELRKV